MLYLYLRRAPQYLDPGSVIPQRVRAAFDSLGEGVVILDAEERVMLTNRVFKALYRRRRSYRKANLHPVLAGWRDGPRQGELPVAPGDEDAQGEQLEVPLVLHGPGSDAELRLLSGRSGDRGRQRPPAWLHRFLQERDRASPCKQPTVGNGLRTGRVATGSRRRTRSLQGLATRDPLTGCLNRRAFFGRRRSLRMSGWRAYGFLHHDRHRSLQGIQRSLRAPSETRSCKPLRVRSRAACAPPICCCRYGGGSSASCCRPGRETGR